MTDAQVGRGERILVPLVSITIGALLSLGATQCTAFGERDHADDVRREDRRAARASEMIATFRSAINDMIEGTADPAGFADRFTTLQTVTVRTTDIEAAAVAAMIVSNDQMARTILSCNAKILDGFRRTAGAAQRTAEAGGTKLEQKDWDETTRLLDQSADCTNDLIFEVQRDLTG